MVQPKTKPPVPLKTYNWAFFKKGTMITFWYETYYNHVIISIVSVIYAMLISEEGLEPKI